MPEGLTQSPGAVQFNSTAIYPDIGSHINDLAIPMEIISGIGSTNTFSYVFGIGTRASGDLSVLEPLPRVVFAPLQPGPSCPCPDYAAIEVRATIPTSLGSLPLRFTRMLPEDLTIRTGSGRSVIHATKGENITVIFTSPNGLLKYYKAQFSVVLHSAVTFTGAPTIISIRFFDINGNEISGPVADYSINLK